MYTYYIIELSGGEENLLICGIYKTILNFAR